jgi:hypothetical protein
MTMLNGFNFQSHAIKCSDCKKFINSFGKETINWFIAYDGKVFRLDTKRFGQNGYPANEITVTMSDFNPGTRLQLVFHEMPTDKTKLKDLLEIAIDRCKLPLIRTA